MLQNLLVLSCQHFDSKHNSSFLCTYDWITIMGYSKHELSTINMLDSLKKLSYKTPTHNIPTPPPPIIGSLGKATSSEDVNRK